MTNKERVYAALTHKQPDKTPYCIGFTQKAMAAMVALMFCADDSDVKLERPQGINSGEWRLRQLSREADYSNDLVRRGEGSRGNLFMPFTRRRRI
jgi:hypothetical protein